MRRVDGVGTVPLLSPVSLSLCTLVPAAQSHTVVPEGISLLLRLHSYFDEEGSPAFRVWQPIKKWKKKVTKSFGSTDLLVVGPSYTPGPVLIVFDLLCSLISPLWKAMKGGWAPEKADSQGGNCEKLFWSYTLSSSKKYCGGKVRLADLWTRVGEEISWGHRWQRNPLNPHTAGPFFVLE